MTFCQGTIGQGKAGQDGGREEQCAWTDEGGEKERAVRKPGRQDI